MKLQFLIRRLRKNLPRWVIFVVDIYITVLVYILIKAILSFGPNYTNTFSFSEILLVATCYAIGFALMATHKRVVRYTSLRDIVQILKASTIGLIIFFIAAKVLVKDFVLADNLLIFLHFGVTIIGLVFLRILYKSFYTRYVMYGRFKKRVLIFGAGHLGVQTNSAIREYYNSPFSVFGFIDDHRGKVGTKISGVPVFHTDSVDEDFILRHHITEIIFAVERISSSRMSELVAKLELLPVKLKRTPPFRQWLNSTLKPQLIKEIAIEDLLGREPINLEKSTIAQEVAGKVILITGAAGSIGSEIAKQLLHYPVARVVLFDNAESPLYEVQQTFKLIDRDLPETKYIIGDIRDKPRLEALFEKFRPDIVYHAAAYKHVPLMEESPYEAIATNIGGTKNVVDLAVQYGVEKFVLVSTDKAVNPTNVMGATKRIAELYLAQNKNGRVKFVTTRFGNVLGSNGSVIPLFKRQLQNGGPLLVTHADITRYFMTIPEACQLVLEAGAMGNGGEIYVFDMGESVKIIDLAKRIIRLSGLRYPEDIEIKITGLRPGEKIYEELLADDEHTVPTHHHKIMVARTRENEIDDFDQKIEELVAKKHSIYKKDATMDLVRIMKDLVPEYLSQNSVYESIDLEKRTNGEIGV